MKSDEIVLLSGKFQDGIDNTDFVGKTKVIYLIKNSNYDLKSAVGMVHL